jgi:DNA-binding CsgD family transcriptional regulator
MEDLYLVIVNLSAADWSARISAQPQVIGRGNEVEIQVKKSNASVSRKHARIWHDERIWIEDLGSTFGTWVNAVKIPSGRPTEISLGDRLTLGLVEIVVVDRAGLEAWTADDRSGSEDSRSEDPMMVEMLRRVAELKLPAATLDRLSHAEREIVMWMMRGVTEPDEIAKRLYRSAHTVRTHLNNIFRKLEVHSRHELMGQLLRHDKADRHTDSGK